MHRQVVAILADNRGVSQARKLLVCPQVERLRLTAVKAAECRQIHGGGVEKELNESVQSYSTADSARCACRPPIVVSTLQGGGALPSSIGSPDVTASGRACKLHQGCTSLDESEQLTQAHTGELLSHSLPQR